jgi:hypothetical protein
MEGLGDWSRLMPELRALLKGNDVQTRSLVARPHAFKVATTLAEGDVIWPRVLIKSIEIETIVFPETHHADVVSTTRVKREVVAVWALANRIVHRRRLTFDMSGDA